MHVGEPLASDGPIMEVTARIRIMRAAIAEATSTFIEMNTGSLAIFVTIRRALAGCTPGAASTKLCVWKETLRSGERLRPNSWAVR